MGLILGLDIGDDMVRGAFLRTQLRKSELIRYEQSPISVPRGAEGRADAVRAAVQGILATNPRPPDQVICDLDGQKASLRVVELPAGAAKRVAEVLPFELESLLPFPASEAVVDHQLIGPVDGQLRFLTAAVPRDHVIEHLDDLRAAGLEPRELAVGAAAFDGLIQLLPELQTPGPHLIVDIGQNKTDVCVLANGRCELARTVTGGIGDLRTRRSHAETALKRTLASYRAGGGAAPEKVLMTGAITQQGEGAASWLAGVLDLEVERISLPALPGADDAVRPLFARAAALAGRVAGKAKRIDLRQGDLAAPAAMGNLRQHGRLLAVCVVSIVLSFGFSIYARYSSLDTEQEALHAELQSVTEELFGDATSSPTQARELLEGGRSDSDPLPRFDAWDILDSVSGAIPSEITHDTRRLSIEIDDEAHDGRFEIQGTVASIAERDTIAEQLEAHECFRQIKRGPTSPGPRNEGLNYRLEVDVRCPGAPEPTERRGGSKNKRRRRGSR